MERGLYYLNSLGKMPGKVFFNEPCQIWKRGEGSLHCQTADGHASSEPGALLEVGRGCARGP